MGVSNIFKFKLEYIRPQRRAKLYYVVRREVADCGYRHIQGGPRCHAGDVIHPDRFRISSRQT